MQEISFTYTPDGGSNFTLSFTSEGSRVTNSDIVMMGNYIHLLFLTIRQVGEFNAQAGTDIDEMIRNLMNRDEQ